MSRTRRPAEPGGWRDGMGREVGGVQDEENM